MPEQQAPNHAAAPNPPPLAGARPTISDLRRIGRKGGASSRDDPFWISRIFYRPWTIYVTWACLGLGLTANAVTLLSAVAIFLAAFFFLAPSPWMWLIAAALVQIYFTLDHVDGEMARWERVGLGKQGGMAGPFLDSAAHAGFSAMYAAIALRISLDMGGALWVASFILLAFFPGAIRPWEKYCETIAVYAQRRIKDNKVTLPAEVFFPSTMAKMAPASESISSHRRLLAACLQIVGFPGWWVTVCLCALLDALPGVPHWRTGGVEVRYLLLWIIVIGVQMSLANIKGTLVFAARLRKLT